ncbi:MAG TPA: MBL fold metallo-hydrolase [Terriglobia bacterium]|nr:MBL fold metallo-hydrolase [Terriglobia bacterium]
MNGFLLAVLLLVASGPARAAQTLNVYFIDTEGGQSTLFVSPSGESMLVDTGWPDFNGRDANRIVAAAKHAGLSRIDYLLITHYHMDHVGGVPQLAARIPIRNFIDHGPSVEHGKEADELVAAYAQATESGHHILAHPGERIPIRGIDVEILTAAGNEISSPLPGAGAANPYCAAVKLRETDPSENAQSVGTLITFGKFRMIDLGDLTWNKEYELVCPNNKIGTVDVYLSTHHGLNESGGPEIVHVLHPRVAIMNNGATKGGSTEAWQAMHSSSGIENLWQLHYAVAGGDANNSPQQFIANPEADPKQDRGYWIELSAESDGSFSVTNSRTGETKKYPAAGR